MSELFIESSILQEAETVKILKNKAIYRCVIQCDEPNRNQRIYPKDVLMQAMKEKLCLNYL